MKRALWVALAMLTLAPPAFGLEEDYRFDIPYPYKVTRPEREKSEKKEEEKKKAVDCAAVERERDAAQKKVRELKRTIETQQQFILGQQELIRRLREELFHKDQVIRGLFQQLRVR
ncbi:MAG: hypothetical protein P8Z70_10775 [Desulfuromonadales bacterium]|jgi:hypothetical protein